MYGITIKVTPSDIPKCITTICFDIIPHLHNSFLFQCDVTWSLNRFEGPEQTVYLFYSRADNSVSTVSIYWPIQV